MLLDAPQIVTKQDEDYMITLDVLKEIDSLKITPNANTAEKARRAAVIISKNMDNLKWDCSHRTQGTVDDRLLEITKERDAILVTNDVALKVRATVLGIKNEGYTWKENYTGIKYLEYNGSDEEYEEILANLWTSGTYEDSSGYKFSNNEYLIAPPPHNNGESSIFRYNDGKLNPVQAKAFKNDWTGEIFPRNNEQICLVDALLNKDIGIIYSGGGYGTGKSYLTSNYAISQLEKENIKKIVYVPNNAYVRDTLDLGALPG